MIEPRRLILVWDPLVRILHWTLASLVLVNFFLTEEGETVHRYTGYAALAVVFTRLAWGLISRNPYTRLSGWFPTPKKILAYLRDKHRHKTHLGHNPLAALMILWLLSLVIALGISGWLLTLDAFFGDETLESIHEIAGKVLIGSALLHAAAAVVTSILEKRNRILAMIHGRLPE